MANPDSSLFLTRLTHDARLEIYLYLILPPLDGCQILLLDSSCHAGN
jgi:hypothetical protein